GTSMLPLLVWGRDTVELTKCENPQKYDIIFYRRDDEHFVLHRIVGKNEKGFILCGDNQVQKEYGINETHIIAVVKSITRKGKTFSVNKFSYKIYVKLWTLILPFRNIILVPLRKIGLLK
ncbi:MAG: S24/S26 family peptidase, partial [Clostridia bacterium]|nr:S24/S26 family peptidase [Clostridia bacterium]